MGSERGKKDEPTVRMWEHGWSASDGPPPEWARQMMADDRAMQERVLTRRRLANMTGITDDLRRLMRGADRVARDVAVTTGLELDYVVEGPDAEGAYRCYKDGPSARYLPGADLEDFVAALADEVSDWVCETLANTGRIEEARYWPHCPVHAHSLDPVTAVGLAVWRCRDDNTVSVGIGALEA